MANLYLTHKCRRCCPFCFARKVLAQSRDANEIMTLEEVSMLLSHFKGQFDVLGLLGGEPFLYPHLKEVIELLWNEHIAVKIFTSATDPMPQAISCIDLKDAIGRMNFVVNVGTRDTYNDKQFNNLEIFFDKFAPLSTLSFTIFDLKADPSYLFDMIDKYRLNRSIRVGIALPIYNGGNSYIPLEEYRKAGNYFVNAAVMAAERQITLSMDCGFIACMFTTGQIGLLERLGAHVQFSCGSALDIGPGLKAWNCFPLFQLGRVNVLEAKNIHELNEMLRKCDESILGQDVAISQLCHNCDMARKGLCEKGCRSFKSLKLNNHA